MNAPHTQLDHFETALLGELRTHVATRTPERRPRHVRRWAIGLAAAAAAGAAVVVTGLGDGSVVGPAPAYAVDVEDDGEVVVTIDRLEDAAGLQSALRAAGIDASVTYNPTKGITQYAFPNDGSVPDGTLAYMYGARSPQCQGGADPVTVSRVDDVWELRIPADSPAQDGPVTIGTSADRELTVGYLTDEAPPGALGICAALTRY